MRSRSCVGSSAEREAPRTKRGGSSAGGAESAGRAASRRRRLGASARKRPGDSQSSAMIRPANPGVCRAANGPSQAGSIRSEAVEYRGDAGPSTTRRTRVRNARTSSCRSRFASPGPPPLLLSSRRRGGGRSARTRAARRRGRTAASRQRRHGFPRTARSSSGRIPRRASSESSRRHPPALEEEWQAPRRGRPTRAPAAGPASRGWPGAGASRARGARRRRGPGVTAALAQPRAAPPARPRSSPGSPSRPVDRQRGPDGRGAEERRREARVPEARGARPPPPPAARDGRGPRRFRGERASGRSAPRSARRSAATRIAGAQRSPGPGSGCGLQRRRRPPPRPAPATSRSPRRPAPGAPRTRARTRRASRPSEERRSLSRLARGTRAAPPRRRADLGHQLGSTGTPARRAAARGTSRTFSP